MPKLFKVHYPRHKITGEEAETIYVVSDSMDAAFAKYGKLIRFVSDNLDILE